MRLPLALAIYKVLREEGMSGAWRGLSPRLIWSAPLAAATFTYYQSLKQATGGDTPAAESDVGGSSIAEERVQSISPPPPDSVAERIGKDQLRTLLLGPAVMALSVGLRTPFDIVEQQLQLTSLRNPAAPKLGPPSPAEVFARIQKVWAEEGVRGVWRVRSYPSLPKCCTCALGSQAHMGLLQGYPAAFLGIFTYVAGYFVMYEAARRSIEKTKLGEYPTTTHLIAGGLGGGATAALSTPFDTVKVRMQTKVYATEANPFPSIATVARATIRDAGIRGLWRGVMARIASNAPSGAIMFAVYESGHRWIEANL
ncbi:MAG: hypothetical protein SGPRY_013837 [Prymnesium sp.]